MFKQVCLCIFYEDNKMKFERHSSSSCINNLNDINKNIKLNKVNKY